jgi:hypothetical protein
MFWPFRRKPADTTEHDRLFLTTADKHAWIAARSRESVERGRTPLIVAHFLDSLDHAAAIIDPTGDGSRILDTQPTPVVLAQLTTANTPWFALADFLTVAGGAAPAGPVPIDLFVVERHFLRARDDRLGAFARALGPDATLRFHISIEEPLMGLFSGEKTAAALRALGMKEGDSIIHPMLHRSVSRAQQKIALRATGDGFANSADEWRQKYIRI